MTAEKLHSLLHNRRAEYASLVEECGSVSELILKIEVRGNAWTQWDWVLFMHQIDFYGFAEDSRVSSPWYENCGIPKEQSLMLDILSTIDSSAMLDRVFTNKAVVMSFIGWLKLAPHVDRQYGVRGILRLLAHVFRKFPDMWNMNWMFVRHRGANAGKRTHRLEWTISDRISRPASYFSSSAYREDFINLYWR